MQNKYGNSRVENQAKKTSLQHTCANLNGLSSCTRNGHRCWEYQIISWRSIYLYRISASIICICICVDILAVIHCVPHAVHVLALSVRAAQVARAHHSRFLISQIMFLLLFMVKVMMMGMKGSSGNSRKSLISLH